MMRIRFSTLLAAALLCLAPIASQADLSPFVQDFEGLDQADPNALTNDGWLVFANVFNADWSYAYGYGPFPAPNGGQGFSAIIPGPGDPNVGGPAQGAQQLSVYSDYNNSDHGIGRFIEANTFQEQIVGAADVGTTWKFSYDATRGNIGGGTTALAFFKTLDPNAGFALTNFITVDMTNVTTDWTSHQLSINIDQSLVGQILQFGFLNTATNYDGSAVYYDNVEFAGFITLCHYPPGNPDNGHTITVGLGAKDAHMGHGDTIGACPRPGPDNVTEIHGGTGMGPVDFGNKLDHSTPPVMHRRPKAKVGNSKPKLVDPSGR